MKINIDFETTSPVDLPRCGVHVYAKDPRTEVLCCAYSVDNGPVKVWKMGDKIPPEFYSEDAHFHAWNAQFERTIWKECLHWPHVPINRWHCTMSSAASKGLPLHLVDAANALHAEFRKDSEGHSLMKKLSKMPSSEIDSEQLKRLYQYCQQDVLTERSIESLIGPLIGPEYNVWCLDQIINDRGLGLDRNLVDFLLDLTSSERTILEGKLYELTDGKITSLHQHVGLKKWLEEQGLFLDSLRADNLKDLNIEDKRLKEVISLRLEGAKSSLAKLDSMRAYDSGRLRGLFQYHGAATGRWAGRGVQLQNFPRTVPNPPVEEIMWLPRELAAAELRGRGGVMSWAASALRSCIIPAEGRSLYVADYSQIETRILAWLSDDMELLEAFNGGIDPYIAFASSMYNVKPDQVTKQQRQIAKSAVLGLGYSMGALRYRNYAATYGADLSLEEAQKIVAFYRANHAPIVAFWRNVERAAARAMHTGKAEKVGKVWLFPRQKNLICRLPSGRELTYWDVRIDQEEWMIHMTYMRREQTSGEWVRRKLYGGLITENIVQGTARDVMVHGMKCVEQAGLQVVGTIHDEILAEGEPFNKSFEESLKEMPSWLNIRIPTEHRECKRWSK